MGKGADGLSSGYRPICILSNWNKVLESVIKEKLLGEQRENLAPNQFGFRESLFTVHSLRELMSRWDGAMLRNQHCMLVTVDVRNVFNTLEWSIIIRELKARNCAKGLISSYLSEKRVTAETTERMKTVAVYAGVPQGSIIGLSSGMSRMTLC